MLRPTFIAAPTITSRDARRNIEIRLDALRELAVNSVQERVHELYRELSRRSGPRMPARFVALFLSTACGAASQLVARLTNVEAAYAHRLLVGSVAPSAAMTPHTLHGAGLNSHPDDAWLAGQHQLGAESSIGCESCQTHVSLLPFTVGAL